MPTKFLIESWTDEAENGDRLSSHTYLSLGECEVYQRCANDLIDSVMSLSEREFKYIGEMIATGDIDDMRQSILDMLKAVE